MKAYYHLAQAQIALHRTAEALESSKMAHKYCVEEIHKGGKGGSSIGAITELVLRCKKERWEELEDERLRRREGLLEDIVKSLEAEKEGKLRDVVLGCAEHGLRDEEVHQRKEDIEKAYKTKIEDLRSVFEKAGVMEKEGKRRKVPDWCVDDITFAVMLDPVVVSQSPSVSFLLKPCHMLIFQKTKTGQSYDRSSIMEHLRRSPTDPLTREPLRVADLRPNLALKAACDEFLQENGWAVDW
jgi:STIP1 family protein 1